MRKKPTVKCVHESSLCDDFKAFSAAGIEDHFCQNIMFRKTQMNEHENTSRFELSRMKTWRKRKIIQTYNYSRSIHSKNNFCQTMIVFVGRTCWMDSGKQKMIML
jgi:hypothetical protein